MPRKYQGPLQPGVRSAKVGYGARKRRAKSSKTKKNLKGGLNKVEKKQTKELIKKAIQEDREYNNVFTKSGGVNMNDYLCIGHPSTYPTHEGSFYPAGESDDKHQARAYLLTNYITMNALNTGAYNPDFATGADTGSVLYRQRQKVYLKGINIQLEIITPYGHIQDRVSSYWSNLHALIVRTNSEWDCSKGLPIEQTWKANLFDDSFAFNNISRDQKRPFTVLKHFNINCSPSKLAEHLDDDNDGEEFPSPNPRIIRKNIYCKVDKHIWVKYNPSLHGTDSTMAGNQSSFNYWLVFYSYQQKQYLHTNGLYNNRGNSGETGSSDFLGAKHAGIQLKFTTSLTGYGADGNHEVATS